MIKPYKEHFDLYRDTAFRTALRLGNQVADAEDLAQEAQLALLQARKNDEEIQHEGNWRNGHVRIGTARYWKRQRDEPISLESDPSEDEVLIVGGHQRSFAHLPEILEALEPVLRPLLTAFQSRRYDSLMRNKTTSLDRHQGRRAVAIAKKLLRIPEILAARGH